MKTKTVAAIIAAKVYAWQESIDDEAVKALAKRDTIVTGGCIASMLLGEAVNDFDIYFTTRETVLAIANYYVSRFQPEAHKGIPCAITVEDNRVIDRVRIVVKSAGIASEDGTEKPYEYFESRPAAEAQAYVADVMGTGAVEDAYEATEQQALNQEDDDKPKFRPVFLSTNAITLSQKVQIVLRFYGDAEHIHENYDFVHCTNYWTAKDGVVLCQAALESLITRELRYVGSKYPVCSIMRLRKFIKRGWTINAGQILKMVMQVDALDLTDINVLEDQLTGVDCAYFVQVLEKLKDKDPTKINAAYLVEIIDRMF